MIDFPFLSNIVQSSDSRIVMLIADGLGGLPHPGSGKSELQTANIPNIDRIARNSVCGLSTPVLTGVTPGSGPGHLALFGYDPLKYIIGRGVLEALGIGIDIREGYVAARGNFCTVDDKGFLTDRRAGRISNAEAVPLCNALNDIEIDGVDISIAHVKEHRFVLLMKGVGLDARVSETDPQNLGVMPLSVNALVPEADKVAMAANAFAERASHILGERNEANMVLLRGFSSLPKLPSMGDAYRLRPAAIAAYPMYKGLAQVVGMQVLSTGDTFADEISTLKKHYGEHDFFYIHYKPTDAAGEDGDFDAKVRALEELDSFLPAIENLAPDVLIITGDHSTPSIMAAHSWHPVPLLLNSQWTHGQGTDHFNEETCAGGSLGNILGSQIMMLALAHAGKLVKFGP